jgi:hypothetical protein
MKPSRRARPAPIAPREQRAVEAPTPPGNQGEALQNTLSPGRGEGGVRGRTWREALKQVAILAAAVLR